MQVFPRNTPSARGQWVVLPVNVAHGDFPIPQNLASLAPSSGSAICDCRSYSTSSGESGNSSSERPGGKKRKTSTESTWSRLWNSHSNFGQIINISGSIQQTAAVVSFLWGKNNPETSMVFHHRAHHPHAPLSSTSPPSKGQHHLG